MTNQHPITPPLELVQQWFDDARNAWAEPQHHVATQAAQWGADQELDACCGALDELNDGFWSEKLRAARRPKPPSLKKQALEALDRMDQLPTKEDQHIIRRALEAQ
jgi:hypothetical protein